MLMPWGIGDGRRNRRRRRRAGASGVVDGIEKYTGGATANMHAGEMWVAREGWAREKVPNALLPLYTPTAMQKNTKQKATRYLHTHHK